MDRQDYNECMKPYISGKGKTKEERQQNFCVGAKICTGKAQNQEEAIQICSMPKPPKEPKERKSRVKGCPACPPCNCSGGAAKSEKDPMKDILECPDRNARINQTIEKIMDTVKAGDAETAMRDTPLLLYDVLQCHPKDTGIPDVAADAVTTLKEMTKGFYFKGEINELNGKFETLKKLL